MSGVYNEGDAEAVREHMAVLKRQWDEAIAKNLKATANPRCCGRFMHRDRILKGCVRVYACAVCQEWTTAGVPQEPKRGGAIAATPRATAAWKEVE